MTDLRDAASSIAGGGAGLALLATVRWETIPYGECAKIAVAIALTLIGYRMYGGRQPKP